MWASECNLESSMSLRLPKSRPKICSSDTVRVWWAPVLTRGKLHIEPLSDNFPGETQEGAAEMVAKVRAALNIRFQGSTAPNVLFTDRGNGFWNSATGIITDGYKGALREHGLKAFFGNDASIQPGQLQEVMLHETAVAWMRLRLSKTLPKKPWKESPEEYRARLKLCAQYCNDNYDVAGLCNELPQRLELLDEKKGDRINK